jgi:glucose-6-phosphate dehydrogenase assembly protein OpcA
LEDVVSTPQADGLLRSGTEVPFAQIESALAQAGQDSTASPASALTATVVVVGPRERLTTAAEALEVITDAEGIRAILISNGSNPAPTVRVAHHAIELNGLLPDYLNNAVAALRLSSLPTMVWWRGGTEEALDGVAALADRLVLDADDPAPEWARIDVLAGKAATSDLRWTRLTRWRALMAHFFDIPEVRAAAPAFQRLEIDGADRHAARLFAGWMKSSLQWKENVSIVLTDVPGGAAIERVRLGESRQELTLRLAASRTCVEAAVHVDGVSSACRTVSLGDQGLGALIAEELRVRSRDEAFERAVRAAGEIG